MSNTDPKKMLAELEAAGKPIDPSASVQDIEDAYLELLAEQDAKAAPKPEKEAKPENEAKPAKPAKGGVKKGDAAWNEALAKLGNHKYGHKSPDMVAWARANMSPEDFREAYHGLFE
jgi:hypothetical protein